MKTPTPLLPLLLLGAAALLSACGPRPIVDLPRSQTPPGIEAAARSYIQAFKDSSVNVESLMILKGGKVVFEQWFGDGAPDKPHVMHSVSKTFTATAVGFAVQEGLLKLDDKVADFFPDKLPPKDSLSEECYGNLREVTVRDLLTMSGGHDTEPRISRQGEGDWVRQFLAAPFVHKPGTFFTYNSMGTYVLSAIVQKVTGEKIVDYLAPRLFEPLHIDKPQWQESPQGINTGGWGLYIKTEDMAKFGQLLLDGGKWNGKQLISSEWVKEATSRQGPSFPGEIRADEADKYAERLKDDLWGQGYCYQMWCCRGNAVRADGAQGQYIILLPDKDLVVVTTASHQNVRQALYLLWNQLIMKL